MRLDTVEARRLSVSHHAACERGKCWSLKTKGFVQARARVVWAQRQTCLSDDADFERRLVLERKGLVLERHHDAGRRRDRVQACSDEDDDINTDDGQGMCKRC